MPYGGNLLRSRVVGEGKTKSPEGAATAIGPAGTRFSVANFAEALYQLALVLVDTGVVAHYEEHVTQDVHCEMTHELNARIEELVIATEGRTKWQDQDVDEVFAAVHEAVGRPDSHQANEQTVGRSSGSRSAVTSSTR